MANKELPTLGDVSRVPEELLPVLHWWQDRGPKTLAYVAAAIIVVAGVTLWAQHRAQKQATTVAQLTTATTAEDYEAILAQGTATTAIAKLDLAKQLFAAGDYEAALATYDQLSGLDDPAFAPIVTVGRILSLEALGKTDEALAAVATAEETIKDAHFLAAELTMAKARLQAQKGDKAAAKATLQPLLTSDNASTKARAERIESVIEAK